ncbi:MAG: hypothetical protein ACR2GY_14620 [Phycisphaerales bacterium]
MVHERCYRRHLRALVVIVVMMGGGIGGLAFAQTSQPDRPVQSQQKDEGILSGPIVRETPGEAGGFMPGTREAARNRGGAMTPQRWLEMVRELNLTDEQRAAIEGQVAAFENQQRAFQAEHGETLRKFNEARQQARRDGNDGRLDRELIEKVQAAQAVAPKPEAFQQAVWDLLNDEQQDVIIEQIETTRRRQMQRREQQQRERANAEDGAAMSDTMAMRENADGAGDRPRSRARTALDPASRRRLEFLRRHQSDRPAGTPPSTDDLEFDFETESEGDDGRG